MLKPLYTAKEMPALIEAPPLNCLMINGMGDPKTAPEFAQAVQALYSIAYAMKFSLKKAEGIDYPVMALEGL